MTYNITVFGCQMNKSDAERLETILIKKMNLRQVSQAEADLVIFVACSVRQTAIDRIWGQTRNIKLNTNRSGKKKIVALTGCILPSDKEKFGKQMDIIFDIRKMDQLPQLVKKFQTTRENITLENKQELNQKYLQINPTPSSSFEAYVPIMNGCNNFCTYCAVPYTRGREISRPVADILKEVKNLVKKKYKLIMLLGQNVNSYQGLDENDQQISFAELLKKIDKIEGDYWLNFTSSHPKDLSPEVIKCFGELKHLTPYLHLALQSGSDRIIKAMNRHYTAENYKQLISNIRKVCPKIAITTDIIVGFPGETARDFVATKKIMKEVEFDLAFLAQFSPRPDTVAWNMDDNVPKTTKKQRAEELNEILKKTSLAKNKQLVGQKIRVLVESKKGGYFFGKTNQFKNVKIKSVKNLQIGEFAEVEIEKANVWSLSGSRG